MRRVVNLYKVMLLVTDDPGVLLHKEQNSEVWPFHFANTCPGFILPKTIF